MGEVFRARDTKLNRDVVIKVLPTAFADDPERLARFTREAQTLASLDHPNITATYGIEEVPAVSESTGRVVESFEALIATPLRDGVNAVCWPRNLQGDFDEVVRSLGTDDDITSIDEARLRSLEVGPAGREAVGVLLDDLARLRAIGEEPALDCVRRYPRDHEGPVSTDVHSFHVDRATAPFETFLCSYAGAASEGLPNQDARRLVDAPAVRAQLLERFGGEEGEAFTAWLTENSFDLHYEALPGARPFSFGLGNLWRIAVQYPGCPVPACIHRAPEDSPGRPPRLLLIS